MQLEFLKIIILTILALPLSACMVGPDFVKPETVPTPAYVAGGDPVKIGAQQLSKAGSIAPNWWHDFNSPQLNTLLELGLANNYDLAAMQASMQQAAELLNAQSGLLWPQLSLNAAAGRQKYGVALFGPANFKIPPFTYYEIGPSFNMLLDIFGGTRRSIEKQQALTVYQSEQRNATVLTLTGDIVTTAINIAAVNAEIATTNQIIADDHKNLELVQQAVKFGSATKTEELSAQSQLENDTTLLPDLYQQLSLAENAMSVLVGKSPANWQSPSFKLKDFTLPKKISLIVPSELVHKRPDILAAEALLHAACADVGIATANLYPSINLSGSVLQEALSPNNLFKSSATAFSWTAAVTAPIFNGGSLRAERRAAEHAYTASYAKYQQVVIKAFAQVSDTLRALEHDKLAVSTQKRASQTAKESLRLARLSYNAGNVGILQVLDAERLYAQARLGLLRAKAQRYQDTVQLYLALGGGL